MHSLSSEIDFKLSLYLFRAFLSLINPIKINQFNFSSISQWSCTRLFSLSNLNLSFSEPLLDYYFQKKKDSLKLSSERNSNESSRISNSQVDQAVEEGSLKNGVYYAKPTTIIISTNYRGNRARYKRYRDRLNARNTRDHRYRTRAL